MPPTALLKNITLNCIPAMIMVCLSINLYASDTHFLPEADVERFHKDLSHKEIEVREEALVKFQWAGISDERVLDYIVGRLQSNKKMPTKFAKIYLAALVYSGNPKYLAFLDSLSKDKGYSGQVRSAAKKYMFQFDRYQSITAFMNENNSATTSEEFWAKRYEKGLRVSDNVRVRWAARDLYLSGTNESSYEVARIFLTENYKTTTDDSYYIDALAFLCKSLGLSRNSKYRDILIEVANNTPNKKLAKYAERSVQYFDQTFKSTNDALKEPD